MATPIVAGSATPFLMNLLAVSVARASARPGSHNASILPEKRTGRLATLGGMPVMMMMLPRASSQPTPARKPPTTGYGM